MQKILAKKYFIVAFLFFAAVFLRLYKLPQFLFFGFEQGRDAQIIQDIYQKHEFKLVGPKTDLAGIFHGAYYYYLLIPVYVLTHGNPLAAAFFLILLNSSVVVIMYFFAKEVFGSVKMGLLGSFFVTVSYDLIIYARWLSNVTPAIPLTLLSFYFLWMYRIKKREIFLIFATLSAAFAAQFEIVLVLLFGFVILSYFLLRVISLPKLKTFLIAVVSSALIFTPHLIFNLRNQNIIITSIHSFLTENKGGRSSHDWAWDTSGFVQSYQSVFRRTLSLPSNQLQLVVGFFIVIGLVCYLFKKQKREKVQEKRKVALFFFIWLWMCAPVIFFHDVSHLQQLYLGTGFPLIFLFLLALQTLWRMPIGKIGVLISGIILLFGWATSFQNLSHNEDVFFVTIQKDLNYADQQKVLTYIHDDAQGKVYRFTAFTIPYFHPEGWQYLRKFFYPTPTPDDGAKLVYVVIEKEVDPYWEKMWINDLGPSQLQEEKTFGQIRVQKRILTNP
jgi:4-amino-4-deoxy-L-arabinose transferase-like glycosyltransferase